MLISVYSKYILDCLKEVGCIRTEVICWLCKLKFNLNEEKIMSSINFLSRGNHLVNHKNYITLPRHRANLKMMLATELMMDICGNYQPQMLRGVPPCLISFYIKTNAGGRDFRVVQLDDGYEQFAIDSITREYKNHYCTWLFLVQERSQIDIINTDLTAVFVVYNKDGGFEFLQKTDV